PDFSWGRPWKFAAICSLILVFKPDPDPEWPARGSWIAMGVAVLVLALYAVLLTPLGFIVPTIFAAGILSYQISPRPGPAVLSGIGLSLGLFVLFKYALGLGNIVAWRTPTAAKLWDAISILIPFVGH
ncbi:MAG: tripartite tricarboxylate transporter TctB family protein, partial [Rhodobacteraceae bacterium]